MKSIQPLIISLLLHLCLVLALVALPGGPRSTPRSLPIEVVYENSSAPRSRQIVADPETKLKEALKELKDKVERLSHQTKRVREETVARRSGETRNASGENAEASAQPTSREVSQNSTEKSQSKNIPAFDPEGLKRDLKQPLPNDVGGGNVGRGVRLMDSTIADYIPEVREGGFTSLNTDQFLYYTFYARINDQIRSRWVEGIRNYLASVPRMKLQTLSRNSQLTQLEVILNREGQFVKALLHRKASVEELDAAALSAFRLAAPFLNPPEELVQEDGFVHLHYGFFVQFHPRYVAGSK